MAQDSCVAQGFSKTSGFLILEDRPAIRIVQLLVHVGIKVSLVV